MKRLVALFLCALTATASAQDVDIPDDGPARGPGVEPGNEIPGGRDPQLNDDEREVLRDVEELWKDYVDAADRHQARLKQEMLGELDRRIAELEKRYADKIAKAESDKLKFRNSTKELLLQFIKDHPNHEKFTPDARFRLADIYLSEADEAVDAIEDPTALVMADYSLSI